MRLGAPWGGGTLRNGELKLKNIVLKPRILELKLRKESRVACPGSSWRVLGRSGSDFKKNRVPTERGDQNLRKNELPAREVSKTNLRF